MTQKNTKPPESDSEAVLRFRRGQKADQKSGPKRTESDPKRATPRDINQRKETNLMTATMTAVSAC